MATSDLPDINSFPVPHFKYARHPPRQHPNGNDYPINDPDGFDVRVSDPVQKEASRLMRKILGELEKAGFKVEIVTTGHPRGTFAYQRGTSLQVYILERTRLQRVRASGIFPRKAISVPRGLLRVVLVRMNYGSRLEFEDGRRKGKLVDQVPMIVESARSEVEAALRREAEREAERIEAERQRLREREAEQKRKAEEERFTRLRQAAMEWREAAVIHDYLDWLEAERPEEREYVEWARGEVKRRLEASAGGLCG